MNVPTFYRGIRCFIRQCYSAHKYVANLQKVGDLLLRVDLQFDIFITHFIQNIYEVQDHLLT